MAKQCRYADIKIFTQMGVMNTLSSVAWNKGFIHLLKENKRFFSIRVDKVKKEREKR